MTLIRSNLHCPKCGGKDPASIYKNIDKETGEEFLMFNCFQPMCRATIRLGTMEPDEYMTDIANGGAKNNAAVKETFIPGLIANGKVIDLRQDEDPWGNRGITEDTCRYFGVSVSNEVPFYQDTRTSAMKAAKGEPVTGKGLIFPYYDDKSNCIAQKIRTGINKKGSWFKTDDNAIKRIGFFGQQLWKSNAIRDIVVTFGELDAMAVYQMLGVPVVSVNNGDGSAPVLFKTQYNWLQRFNNIILVPDNDESCRSIIPIIGAIFPRKTKIVNLTKHKDPNDYLKEGDRERFISEFYAAQPFTPEKIISLGALEHLLYEAPPVPIAEYPWEGLNKMTGGVWPGELITVKAPPKVGKTTFFTEIAHHLYHTTDKPIGLIYLEETQRDLIFRFMSISLNKNLQRTEVLSGVSKDELRSGVEEFVKDDRIFVVDHWGSCSSDFLEDKIKEFVLAKSCQFIFFDHISMAITDESNKDERLALDRLVASIKALTVGIPDEEAYIDTETGETKVRIVTRQPTIFMITHVNDNGQPRGSRAAIQMSNLVIGLARDKMSEDPMVRNMTQVIVEENRRYGESGTACVLSYNSTTGRLTEVPVEIEHD